MWKDPKKIFHIPEKSSTKGVICGKKHCWQHKTIWIYQQFIYGFITSITKQTQVGVYFSLQKDWEHLQVLQWRSDRRRATLIHLIWAHPLSNASSFLNTWDLKMSVHSLPSSPAGPFIMHTYCISLSFKYLQQILDIWEEHLIAAQVSG